LCPLPLTCLPFEHGFIDIVYEPIVVLLASLIYYSMISYYKNSSERCILIGQMDEGLDVAIGAWKSMRGGGELGHSKASAMGTHFVIARSAATLKRVHGRLWQSPPSGLFRNLLRCPRSALRAQSRGKSSSRQMKKRASQEALRLFTILRV
jgi:hypothetical protein